MEPTEFMESTTVRFEWTVRGVQELFESRMNELIGHSSKGDTKSKVTKSTRFGGGRWQILFYPNAGIANAEGQGFVSLYLACEPTAAEKENAVNGKWVREGVYKFGFELRNLQKTIVYNTKEANDHSFSYKTVNWGWAQFALRERVYHQSNSVKQSDALVIICTITSSPTPPAMPPTVPRHPVPKDLLEAMGSLLDDPAYSDIEFVLPRRHGKGSRSIYAVGRLLKRVDYFDTMFRSGFVEGARLDGPSTDADIAVENSGDVDMRGSYDDEDAATPEPVERFQDSDDEDDADEPMSGDGEGQPRLPVLDISGKAPRQRQDSDFWDTMEDTLSVEGSPNPSTTVDLPIGFGTQAQEAHPNIPVAETPASQSLGRDGATVCGPHKTRVVVRDVAYSTYRAVLHYIYTDTIVFAPLASTFTKHVHPSSVSSTLNTRQPDLGVGTPAATAPETQANLQLGHMSKPSTSEPVQRVPRTRKEWISEWQSNNPGKPRPCSAKAVYRLADRLDLPELKERAFQHIIKSLNADNVAYEVFSDFSAAFEDVRKVEVQFFLSHWADIRDSEAMRNVWQQIRVGRHPGFEEVWPLIAVNLEFNPRSSETNN